MSLVSFARDELKAAGMFDETGPYAGLLGPAILKMIEVFADEGHSGMSASIAVGAFEKLARFEPLTPLTGEDSEWTEVDSGKFQNRRCPHVFKDEGGAYDIEGRIFREPSGICFTSRDSRVPVTFPYTPSRVYVDVDQ